MQPDQPADSAPGPRHLMSIRVYYEDTDAAGVIYYANYLRFCERARTEWLRQLGFEQERLRAETGLVFVVRSVRADYLSPGVLDDLLEVASTVDRVGHASLEFQQTISRGSRVLFVAHVRLACLDLARRKSTAMPASVRECFVSLSRPST